MTTRSGFGAAAGCSGNDVTSVCRYRGPAGANLGAGAGVVEDSGSRAGAVPVASCICILDPFAPINFCQSSGGAGPPQTLGGDSHSTPIVQSSRGLIGG